MEPAPLPTELLDRALDAYTSLQRKRVKALYNLHRAVFAESLVATLLPGAEISRDPAHHFDIAWPIEQDSVKIEVKCSGEYLPRYGPDHRSPAEWSFPIQKRIWDGGKRRYLPNVEYPFHVLVLARHVGTSLEAGWSFYVLNAAEAKSMAGRATRRSISELDAVLPEGLGASVRTAYGRLVHAP